MAKNQFKAFKDNILGDFDKVLNKSNIDRYNDFDKFIFLKVGWQFLPDFPMLKKGDFLMAHTPRNQE